MNRPIISLDFSRDLSSVLDVSEFFVLSKAYPGTSLSYSQSLDDMGHFYSDIDLAIDKRVFLEEAKMDEWQDITPKLHIINKNRDNSLNLVPPLTVPYGAVDARKDPVKSKKKKYSDLFVRKLPRGLRWKRYELKMRGFLYKKRYTFVSIALSALLLSVPTLFYIKYNIEDGYNRLISLKDAGNISEVREDLTSARRSFERANFLFVPFSWIPFDMVDVAGRAGKGGLALTRSLESVVMAVPSNSGSLAPRITLAKNSAGYFRSAPKDIFFLDSLGIDSPTDWIEDNPKMIDTLSQSWKELASLYSGTKGNSRYAQQMRTAGHVLTQISNLLDEYQSGQEYWLQFLGSKTPQRYMVFNQNRDEIRANGGFPGSIISFTFYKGNILDYRSDDVYYYDWNLYPHKELPPPGIALLTTNYGLRDVNYYPDFLQTLEKANDFVERSGESTLTTAIAIHQGMIEDILAIIGPVTVDGISEDFTADNFSTLMSVLVEGEVDREKTPKDILFRFIESFGNKIVQSRKFPEVFTLLQKYWQDGEILMASRDENLQEFISKYTKPLPWKSEPKNWIYPIFTSLSGNKSDRYIDRIFQIDTQKSGNCNFKNTVRITLSHTYSKEDEKQIKNYMDMFGMTDREARAKMQFIQGKGANKSYIRFFVPKGAKLVEGENIETVNKEENTVFTTNMSTPVGKKATKIFSYQVQIPHCNSVQGELEVLRQPGLRNFTVQ